MTEKLQQHFEFVKKMSPLKKAVTVLVILFIFIIVVEQPGSDTSKRKKASSYFLPKLVMEQVQKISIASADYSIELEETEDRWLIANGRSFPADFDLVDSFLKELHSLKQLDVASKNPERTALFGVDDETGHYVQIWNENEVLMADFYAGKTLPNGKQYVRKAESNEVYQVSMSIANYLDYDSSDWKDKNILSIDENQVRRVSLQTGEEELVIESRGGHWQVTTPEEYKADDLSMRTLFEQLKKVRAIGFPDSVDASQVDFENPAYKLSVRMKDETLKVLVFSGPDEDGNYLVKNGEKQVTYLVDADSVKNVFELKFRSE